jgi:hypothetical protein
MLAKNLPQRSQWLKPDRERDVLEKLPVAEVIAEERARLHRLLKNSVLLSGHDFNRAITA